MYEMSELSESQGRPGGASERVPSYPNARVLEINTPNNETSWAVDVIQQRIIQLISPFISLSFFALHQHPYIMSQPQTRKRTSQLSTTKDTVKESATRQIAQVGGIAQDAVISGAWAYPLYVRYIMRA
jgi:hypothetical protein